MGELQKDQIRNAVLLAIDRVRESLVDESVLPRTESAVLLGDDAALDSMGFVNFIVAVEEEMSAVTDEAYQLVDRISSMKTDGPDSCTVGRFIDFLYECSKSK